MKAYHLTEVCNLYCENGIIEKGLIPQCGERSQKIGDNRIVVCFTNDYYTLKVWHLYLYPRVHPLELCVLTFDIPESEAMNWQNETEFATEFQILPENISFANFYDKDTGEEIPFYYLEEGKKKFLDNGFLSEEDIEIEVIETPISMMFPRKLDRITQGEKQKGLHRK